MYTTPDTESVIPYEAPLPFPGAVPWATRPRRTRTRHRTARSVQSDATLIENCRVLNTVVAVQIAAQVRLANRGNMPSSGNLKLEIRDSATQQVLTAVIVAIRIGAGETCNLSRTMSASDAHTWSFDQQNMYQLVASWQADRTEHPTVSRRLAFAFRQFATEGVGRDEMFRLRNRQERLSAVLPWGCWSSSGLDTLVAGEFAAAGRAI